MKKLLKTKGTAILLSVCAATALCVNLANSCSGDEDYDKYRGDELQTHAAATRSVSEEQGTVIFAGKIVKSDDYQANKIKVDGEYCVDFYIIWTSGWTGNINTPQSSVGVQFSPYFEGERINEKYYYDKYGIQRPIYNMCYAISSSGEWKVGNKIEVNFKYRCDTYTVKYGGTDYESEIKTFTQEFSYEELGCQEDTTLLD